MTYKQSTKDSLTVAIGGLFLVALAFSGWFPRKCPVMLHVLSSCPNEYRSPVISDTQAELNRISHQDATTSLLLFTTKSQEYRKETMVNFHFRVEAQDDVSFLQLKYKEGYRDVALVAHPLLSQLQWPTVNEENTRLFQETDIYKSVADMVMHLPTSSSFAADAVAAGSLGLSADTYTPLESLTRLDNIHFILTSQPRINKDGSWSTFSKQFDAQGAEVDGAGLLQWAITRKGSHLEQPFRIGIVHIDYHKIK